ncbi:mammalian cell entry protein [Mycobacterium avium subsp. hominissuis]|jgi:phospholipid/cholesterol/gamma-HCH transport system substrate-binding protein|uniref:Mammalian cell entry protein n=4 Tax=Mycobacterium TaxID=1763 RepID=A0ABX3TG11_9MYCO|nr:mce related family protein [Mycobacterium avium MAV_120709_2344]ETZ45729.1 mce related family protein [Mycobacterium avium MAV_061107_1842]ORB77711.1 mammalian cell entry protein [Mycobacterium timonense]PBA26236.1 mammalian cell entry protein [Mycobacterium avium]PBJ36992.1 mammalian cell entry protein [Mycobacterium avium subsp. hominissuis]
MLGVLGTVILACVTVVAFQYNKLPFIKNTDDYAAYFSEAGGIKPGNAVRVSGMGVGRVSDLRLEGTKVRIGFTVRKGVVLGDRTEAAIKTETILGAKMLELTPRGDGRLSGVIPLERTTSPYDLPDALGDLTTTISGLDTTQLSAALTTLADTLKATPENLKPALQGVARFSDTLNSRDAQLRSLLGNANHVSAVLGRRSQQIAGLVANSNALLAALLDEWDSLDALMNHLTAVSHQISGLVNDNRTQLKPALDKLNGVLEILDNRKEELQKTLPKFKRYAMSFGECLGSGPFFKAYVANLVPGQFGGPVLDADMYDRFLDPDQKLPSEVVDPPTGTPPVPPENAPVPLWSQPPSPPPSTPPVRTIPPPSPHEFDQP